MDNQVVGWVDLQTVWWLGGLTCRQSGVWVVELAVDWWVGGRTCGQFSGWVELRMVGG